MAFLRQLWLDVRGTVLVVAQVITLGVVAMVLGLLALNAVLTQPPAVHPTPQSQPARPLTELVPTLLASTPSPHPTETPPESSPTAAPPLYQPPGFAASTASATASPPTATPPAAPTATPKPAPAPPTATPRPTPTGAPRTAPTPTAGPTGQLMKVLPGGDGLPARVRAEPTTRAPIVVRVPLGATVEVLGQANGDEVTPGNRRWLRVRWKEKTGWIYSSLIGE